MSFNKGNKYTSDIESSSVISDNLTYNGSEIKINIGDAILTISPNMSINQMIMDYNDPDEFERRFNEKMLKEKIVGGKRGKKRKTKGKKNKIIKTKTNKRK